MAVFIDLRGGPAYGHAVGGADSAEGVKPSTDSVVCPLLQVHEEYILGVQDWRWQGCHRNPTVRWPETEQRK